MSTKAAMSWTCLILASVSLSSVSGCAWRFTHLPSDGEFYGSVEGILASYPELERVQPSVGRYWFTAIMDMPYTDELIEAWGEPEDWGLSWWNVAPFTLIPPFHPVTYWRWHKGDKRIYATIDHPIGYGWVPHVWSISVEQLTEDELADRYERRRAYEAESEPLPSSEPPPRSEDRRPRHDRRPPPSSGTSASWDDVLE